MNWRKAQLRRYALVGILGLTLVFTTHTVAGFAANKDLKKQQIDRMYEGYHSKAFPAVPTVMVEELLFWQQSDPVVLVDVRNAKEQAVSMIPSAISVEEFEENLDAYKGHKIVYYCTIGYRSGVEAKKAQKNNLDVYNLHGGVLAWSHAGQPFTLNKAETRDVHVYGKKWNLTPEGYNPMW